MSDINDYRKPWYYLDPNDNIQWWRITDIIDDQKMNTNEENLLYCIILQHATMCGHYWYNTCWYKDNPNKYSNIISESMWNFNKQLNEMNEEDIVYFNDKPHIKFKVRECRYSSLYQRQFIKILERIE